MSSRRFGSQSLVRLLGHWQQTSSRTRGGASWLTRYAC